MGFLEPRDEDMGVAVLGDRVARQLGVRVGDETTLAGEARVRVIGVLAPTDTLTDAFVIAPLGTLQRALGVPGLISLVAVEVEREADVGRVERALREHVDGEVQTQGAFRDVLASLLRSAELLQRAIAGVALLVGFLGVLTTLTATGFERRAELATLRALGLRPARAAGLLVLDGLLLSGAGGMAGVVLGAPLALGVGALTARTVGVRAAVLTPGVLAAVLAVSALIGLLAALPVAWAVSRQPIHEALRAG
ncbi:FtsX-like permease family protein [Deinococcus sp. YIM 134068]|uniref:ABC transporter permease n=1 Tax=Deinococcus lichenicola TaxID=3118910 RepID=UPI002F93915B